MKWILAAIFAACFASLSMGNGVQDSPSLNNRKVCLPGSTWMSQCNRCTCSEDGVPMCTIMACVGQEDEPEKLCAPGTSWMNACNSCSCHDGQAACTLMGCMGFSVL